MSYGASTRTITSTLTQARRLSARIAAELKQVQALYGQPSSHAIEEFAAEAERYLSAGYLDHVSYGFRRNGGVIFELRYTAEDAAGVNDKPGRIPTAVNLSGATWFSYLVPNREWDRRSQAERDAFRRDLPFQRADAPYPTYAAGVSQGETKRFSEETLGLRREVRSL